MGRQNNHVLPSGCERLSALYDHVSGDITCRHEGNEADEKLNGVHLEAIERGKPVALSPITSKGDIAFYALTAPADDLAKIDERLPATLVTRAGNETTIIYALREARQDDPRFPDPDWVWSDEDIIAGDLANPLVYDANIVQRAIWAGPLNAATLFGVLSDEQLALPLRLAFGRNSHEKKWNSQDLTLGDFVSLMTRHEEGEKDGKSFCQGEAIDGARTKTAMKNLCLLGGDIDTGMPLEEVADIVLRSGLTAILYTTHSHMTARTAISYDALVKWMKKSGRGEDEPTAEDVKAYLMEVRHLDARVADTIHSLIVDQTAKGKQAIVEHAPMSKCRVVFPLAKPFDFAKEGKLHSDAIKKWAAKIRGVFAALGIEVDESCTDPSRLFYLPRHGKGKPFEIRVYAGELLDLDQVGGIERGSTARNAFIDAGERDAGKDMGSEKDPKRFIAPDGTDLLTFAKDRGDGFDLIAFFDTFCPEHIRRRDGSKLTVECPFDANHSNPGDVEDPGCFIISASPEENQTFVFRCRHNSCVEHGSTAMLAEAARAGWFAGADIYDDSFDLLPRESASDAANEAFLKLGPQSSTDDIEQVVGLIAATHLSELQRDEWAGKLKAATRRGKTLLADMLKKACKLVTPQKKIRSGRADKRIELWSDEDYKNKEDRVLGFFQNRPPSEQEYFILNDVICRVRAGRLDIKLVELTKSEFIASMSDYFACMSAGDTNLEMDPDRNLFSNVYEKLRHKLPVIKQISSSPCFHSDGSITFRKGYDDQNHIFLTSADWEALDISDNPSNEKIKGASLLLTDPLVEFNIVDQNDPYGSHSRAILLAMIMHPFLRSIFGNCNTPVYVIAKPQPGAGSTLLTEYAGIIATGQPYPTDKFSYRSDEFEKYVSSALRAGRAVFNFDNVNARVEGGDMARLITSQYWTHRPLGQTAEATYENSAQIIITGNKLQLSDEITRRSVFVNLQLSDPLEYERKFRYDDLRKWASDNRDRLVRAVMILLKAWVARRGPDWDERERPRQILRGFELWSKVFASLFEAIDLHGFIPNRPNDASISDHPDNSAEQLLNAMFHQIGLNKQIETGRDNGPYQNEWTMLRIIDEAEVELPCRDATHSAKAVGTWLGREVANKKMVISDTKGKRLIVQLKTQKAPNGKARSLWWLEAV